MSIEIKKILSLALLFRRGARRAPFGVSMLTENNITCGGRVPSEGDSCLRSRPFTSARKPDGPRRSDRRYGSSDSGAVLFKAGSVLIPGMSSTKRRYRPSRRPHARTFQDQSGRSRH